MIVEQSQRKEVWAAGDLYEPYVGRWSRLVATEFLRWLSVPARKVWENKMYRESFGVF